MTGARARADRASHGRCDGSNHRRRRRRRSGRRRRRSFSSRSPATDRRKRAVRRASPATAAARRSRRGSGGGAAHLLPGGEGRRKKRRWKHEKHARAETRRESVRAKARLACLACLAQSLLLALSQFFVRADPRLRSGPGSPGSNEPPAPSLAEARACDPREFCSVARPPALPRFPSLALQPSGQALLLSDSPSSSPSREQENDRERGFALVDFFLGGKKKKP